MNNYQKEYEELIESARSKNRSKGKVYYESHHILPRCMGGSNDKSNLVLLTAIEHYRAHRLLALSDPENHSLVHAWWRMCHLQDGTQVNEIEYEEAREAHAKAVTKRFSGKKTGPMSQEIKKKLSDINKGKKIPKEIVDKIAKANTGKTRSKDQIQNYIKGAKGRKNKWTYITPSGEFASYKEAATNNQISESLLIYRCTNNINGYSRYLNDSTKNYKTGRKPKWTYQTPLGNFDDYKLAAKENGLTASTLVKRCSKNLYGFSRSEINNS